MKYLFLLALLIAGCNVVVPTEFPPAATNTPTETPTSRPSVTSTPSSTPSPNNTPTITNTPAPTLTAWQIDMFFRPDVTVVFSVDNPMQNCILVYFDITTEPGHTGINRRDNGGYFACVAREEANP